MAIVVAVRYIHLRAPGIDRSWCLLLQSKGEFVDTIGSFNETPLNRAVLGGSISTVRILLQAGADVNYRAPVKWHEGHGSILLDCLSRSHSSEKLEMTRLLVEFGVRVANVALDHKLRRRELLKLCIFAGRHL